MTEMMVSIYQLYKVHQNDWKLTMKIEPNINFRHFRHVLFQISQKIAHRQFRNLYFPHVQMGQLLKNHPVTLVVSILLVYINNNLIIL